MKILVISSSVGAGGREMAVPNISKELIKKGHEVFIVVKKGTWLEKECEKLNLPFKSFANRKYFDPKFLVDLKRVFNVFQPEEVHIHFISDIWHVVPLVKLAYPKCKIFLFRHMQSSPMKDLTRTMLFKGLDKIFAVSHFIRNDFLHKTKVHENKVEVLYQGLDIEEFKMHDNDKSFRQELGVSDDTELIGLVGRVDRAKGQDKLIFAAEEILKHKDNVKFAIIGDSEIEKKFGKDVAYVDEIKTLVHEHNLEDYFIFTGFRADVPRVLSSLDIFVCASKEEAFGLVVIEAMAAEKPVVVFDRGALPEMVKNGKTGVVVPYSVKGLANGILAYIKNPNLKKEYAKNAREFAIQNFDIKNTIARIEGYK
ncbi:glycosyltransferase family 4 protein [bacterium]